MKVPNSFYKFTSKFKHFLPSYSEGSGIFFQVTFKIRHFFSKLLSRSGIFFPSYFQDQAFSSKLLPRSDIFLQDLARPDIFLQDQTFSCKIFQDTCKNNALSSKILEVKSDRFLQKMYGSSTRVASTHSRY